MSRQGHAPDATPRAYNSEDLFCKYEVPSWKLVPNAPGRNIQVDKQAWDSLTGNSPDKVAVGCVTKTVVKFVGALWACCYLPRALWRCSGRQDVSVFGLPVLSPDHWFVRLWDGLVFLLDMVYTAFIVCISLAFNDLSGGQITWLTIADIIGTAFYFADMLLGFHVGFVARIDVRRLLVLDGRKVAAFYILHGDFLINGIACLPIATEIVSAVVPSDTSSSYKLTYALRLLRLLRVVRMLRLMWGSGMLHNPVSLTVLSIFDTVSLYMFTVLFTLGVLANMIACIWWFVAELEGLEYSWVYMTAYRDKLLDGSNFERWVTCFYFAITTMTTIGYGDIAATTTAEQLVDIFFMIISVFYFGFLVSVVGELLRYTSRTTRTGIVLRSKLEDMDSWMSERNLRPELVSKVRQFYVEVWAQQLSRGISEEDCFEQLPVALRGEIVLDLAGDALKQSHMFRPLSHLLLAQLAADAMPVQLVAGHNLYYEGDDADSIYMLQGGEVLTIHGSVPILLLHNPAILGQSAVFADVLPECQKRLLSVRATTNCTLWKFRTKRLYELCQQHPSLRLQLCKAYLQYLDEIGARLTKAGHNMPHLMATVRRQIQKLHELVTRHVEEPLEEKAREAGQPGSILAGVRPSAAAAAAPAAAQVGRSAGSGGQVRQQQQQQQGQQGESEEQQKAERHVLGVWQALARRAHGSGQGSSHSQPQPHPPRRMLGRALSGSSKSSSSSSSSGSGEDPLSEEARAELDEEQLGGQQPEVLLPPPVQLARRGSSPAAVGDPQAAEGGGSLAPVVSHHQQLQSSGTVEPPGAASHQGQAGSRAAGDVLLDIDKLL